ncbi:hypothetical protein QBC47DRAFT_388961 [Echria macrotheca]|uniref:Rhodopsin domain-containing protein n=1 Tax=Echria macrotheca TaxID=438768 RepID=A0AAJ0B6I1_9PEZI|nr:hypothetical protein QBC47DRAFT_388961 [Echria macrotheca]
MTIIARFSDEFDNTADLIRSIVLACSLAPAFAALAVGLRFYTARAILRGLHKDDWLILAALVMSIGHAISTIIHTKHGLGLHVWEVQNKKETYRMYSLISIFPVAIFNNMSIMFTKSSILVFYLRFSMNKRFDYTIYAVLSIVIGYCLTGAFAFLYACRPINKFWDFWIPGSCISPNPWYGTLVALNVLTDAILLLLPIWLLKPLKSGAVQKAAIAAVMGTGGFVLGVSIYRLYLTIHYFDDIDFLHRFGVNYLWLVIEVNVAIICACLPCLRALAARAMPGVFSINLNAKPRGLDTIAVTNASTHTQECFQGTVNKPEPSPTMWIESRASSVFFDIEYGPGCGHETNNVWRPSSRQQ